MGVKVLGVVPHGMLGQGVHRLLLDQVRHRFQVAFRCFVQFDIGGLSCDKIEIICQKKNGFVVMICCLRFTCENKLLHLLESKNVNLKQIKSLYASLHNWNNNYKHFENTCLWYMVCIDINVSFYHE